MITIDVQNGKVTVDPRLLIGGMKDELLFAMQPFALKPELTAELLLEMKTALTIAAENYLACRH